MSKKNLPHIPIYVGDWEKDCNVLSLTAEAAWFRIVLKMWTKGKQSTIKMPSKSLQNLWRCSLQEINEILDELVFNEICEMQRLDGFIEFTCRRFQKENQISEIRSQARKTGYLKNKTESNNQQKEIKNPQNADNDNDNDIDNDINYDNDIQNNVEIQPTFDEFWDLYDNKKGKVIAQRMWQKLPHSDKLKIMEFIPLYKKHQPNEKFRRQAQGFFSNRIWEDEGYSKPINNQNGTTQTNGSDRSHLKQRIAEKLQSR